MWIQNPKLDRNTSFSLGKLNPHIVDEREHKFSLLIDTMIQIYGKKMCALMLVSYILDKYVYAV